MEINLRIDQLQLGVPGNNDFGVFRNMTTNRTERFSMAAFIASPSINIEWTSAKRDAGDYDTNSIATRGGKLWQSNIDDNPNVPGAETLGEETWIEIPKGASGFVLWAAGTFVEEQVFTLFEIENKTYIFELADVDRPYTSVDFLTELEAGEWKMLGELQLIEVDTTGADIEIDCRYLERLFFEGNDELAGNKNVSVLNVPPGAAKYEVLLASQAGLVLNFTDSEVPIKSSHGSWDSAAKTIQLYDEGEYKLTFTRIGSGIKLDINFYPN